MRRLYFDYNASAPIDPHVLDAVVEALRACGGNPSSVHREGQRARAAVEAARRHVAALIGAHSTEITFTSGATEANNAALLTLAAATEGALVTTLVEHPSVLAPLAAIEARGRAVLRVAVDPLGMIPEPEDLIGQAERAGAGALSVMLANNETGNLFPVARLAALARARGWPTHCDATQAVGKLPVDVEALGVDLLSLSGHKLGAPKGVGALFARADFEPAAAILGGHQERGRRGGTENVPAIVGLGRAAEIAARRLADEREAPSPLAALRDALWDAIAAIEPRAVRQTHPTLCLPNTLNVRFPDVDGETLLLNLDLDGIAVSAGSACTAGSLEPSHVILAMGVPPDLARGSVRFSLGPPHTLDDVLALIDRLPAVLARTRTPRW